MRALAILTAVWAAVIQALPAEAATLEDYVWFVADVEEAKGHLLASQEVRQAGQRIRAGVHAAHPIQELGHRLWGPVKQVDPALADRVQAALEAVDRAAHAQASRQQYDAALREATTALDEAVRRVVPEAVRSNPAFQIQVIRKLLDLVVEEYEESLSGGRVDLEDEYQDAYGFFRRARALYDATKGRLWPGGSAAAQEIEERMGLLARALPGVTPPASPLPAEQVKAAAEAISNALASWTP